MVYIWISEQSISFRQKYQAIVHMHLFIEIICGFRAEPFSISVSCFFLFLMIFNNPKTNQMLAIILFDGDFLKLPNSW